MRIGRDISSADARDLTLESGKERGDGTSLNNYTFGGHTDLPGVEERAVSDTTRCGLYICVVQDLSEQQLGELSCNDIWVHYTYDCRGLPSQFEDARLEMLRSFSSDDPSNSVASSKLRTHC